MAPVAAARRRDRCAARAAGPRRRPVAGGPRGVAIDGRPGRARANGRRTVSHLAARLVLGLIAFVLVGWGVGELWISIVGSADLNAVRDVAAQRTAALTEVARVVTWAGSAFLLVPLALIACLALARAGLRPAALAVALSLGGAMLISDLVKLLVSRPRPPVEHLQAVSGSSFPSGHATQAGAFWLSLVLALQAAGRAAPANPSGRRARAAHRPGGGRISRLPGRSLSKRCGRRPVPRCGLGSVRVALRAGA